MGIATENLIDQIGETAGVIWRLLSDNGPTSVTRLTKQADTPRDQVMLAIGWLAREGKIEVEEQARGRVISLR
jgi:predicted ArsR family transcriptional regulator